MRVYRNGQESYSRWGTDGDHVTVVDEGLLGSWSGSLALAGLLGASVSGIDWVSHLLVILEVNVARSEVLVGVGGVERVFHVVTEER